MSSLFALRALLFAGECFAGSVLLLGLAAIATRFLRHAAVRHFVWLTAFGAILALPAAALIVPPQIVLHRAVETDSETTEIVMPSFQPHTHALPGERSPSWNIGARDVALGLAVLWSLGFGWAVLRLLIGAIGINALHMSSTAFRRDGLEQLASDVGDCELRLASQDSGPMTWGFARPVILLPNDSVTWPAERLRAVLLHEAAHVRRRDSLAQTISSIACALYWPNPLAWLGARALRRDAEIAADQEVIRAGMKPSVYARELLEIAAAVRDTNTVLASVPMASQSSLERRLEALLSANSSRRGVTSMDVLKIAALGLLATTAVAFARPTLAEDATPSTVTLQPARAEAAMPTQASVPVVSVQPAVSARATEPTPSVEDAAPVDTEFDAPHVHVHLSHHRRLTARERAEIRAAIHHARGVLAQVRPQIEAAMAHAEPDIERAAAEVQRIQPEIDRAMQQVRAAQPEIERAMQQVRDAQPQITMAMEKARIELSHAKFDRRMKAHMEEALARAERKLQEQRIRMEGRERQMDSEATDSESNRSSN